MLGRSEVKSPKIPKVSQREIAEFVRREKRAMARPASALAVGAARGRPPLVEIDLNDVSMMNLQGTSHVMLVCEGTKTAKTIRAALRVLLHPSRRIAP